MKTTQTILSYLLGEAVEEIEFRSIINRLLEKDFISLNAENACLTSIGSAIIESLGGEISEIDKDLVNEIARKYLSSDDEERRELLEDLQNSIEETPTLGRRIIKMSDDDLKSYVTNAVPLFMDDVERKFFRITCRFGFLKSVSTENKYRIAAKLRHQLKTKGTAENCIVTPRDQYLVIVSPTRLDRVQIDGTSLETETIEEVNFSDYAQEFLTVEFIPDILKQRGFTVISGNKYVDYNRPETISTRIGPLKRYPGFQMKIDRIEKLEYIIWIDPFFECTISLMNFISYLKSSGKSENDIEQYLLNQIKVARVLPTRSLGNLTKVQVKDQDTRSVKVPNTDDTLSDFWKDRHNIRLTERQPLVTIKFDDSSFEYPSEVVYIDRRVMQQKFPDVSREIPIGAMNPTDRYSRTLEFMDALIGEKMRSSISFRIRAAPLTMSELVECGFFKQVCYLSPPLLRFDKDMQRDYQTSDPRAVFNYGPYSHKKNVTIHSIVYPMKTSQGEMRDFVEDLRTSFQRYNFGMLAFDNASYFTISEDLTEDRIDTIVKQTPLTSERASTLSIVILPLKLMSQRYRLLFKEKYAKDRDIPTQVITDKTLSKAKSGQYGAIKNILIQIYSKILKEGEAIWVLDKPADDREETMYVGLGFSQKPLEGRKANSFAALCDARGLQMKWKAIGVPFQERYITETWFDGLLAFLSENIGERARRIVVYRKGDTYENEVKVMSTCLDRSGFWKSRNLNFISVCSEMRRVYSKVNGTVENPRAGMFGIVSDSEAICCSSLSQSTELKQGTVIPIRLKKEIGRDSSIEDLVKEYYDLCYLNWSAPITISKFPVILNIANNIAEMVKEVPNEIIFKWLPL